MANSTVVGWLRTMLTMDTASYEAGGRKAVSVNDAVKRSVDGLGKEVAKITPQAEKMVKSLAGDKLLYSANSVVQAITRIGGAMKLTDAEAAKHNRTLTDAIAKYTALGQKAPQAVIDMERATRRTTPALDSLKSSIGSIGPAIAASFTVGAVLNFAKSLGQFAGEMRNLSAETGIGVERLQAFNYIAAGVDLTIQDITNAVGQLQNRLGGGDTSAAGAIRRLGLNLEEIRKARPDEVLFEIATGFKRISDQNERTNLSRDLFGGRAGSRMLRIFEEDLRGLVREAEKAGAVIPQELIEMADSFDSFTDQVTLRFKAAIATMANAWLSPPWVKAKQEAAAWSRMLKEMAPKSPALGPAPTVIGPTADETKRIEAQSEALKKAAAAAAEYQSAVDRLYRDISGHDAVIAVKQLADAWNKLTPEQRANSGIVQDVLKRYEALRKEVGTNLSPVLERLFLATGTLTNTTTDLRDAIAALQPAVNAASDSIEGRLLPSFQGFDQLLEAAKRTKEAREELERLGMIAPDISDQNEHVSETVERQASAWGDLADRLRSSASMLSESALGNLGGLLFGFGTDTRELKRLADEAEQDYLRIKRSGKATAEELMLAFKRFHEAEERANHGFAERFKDVWQGIKTSIQNILNEILQFFTERFLVGLVKGMAGAKLGGWLGNLLGGGASAGAGALMSGGAAAASTTALAMSASTPAIAAGSASAGGAAAAGGGFGATMTSLATNPITWGVAAGLALTWGITKKGWFRGGWEGIEGNDRRNRFWMGNFGGANGGEAMMKGAAAITALTGVPGGGPWWSAMQRADSEDEFNAAQAAIIGLFAKSGRKLKGYSMGGFVPPGVVQPAILHGGPMGEIVAPVHKLMGAVGGRAINIYNHIQAIDAQGVRQWVRSEMVPELKMIMLNDTDGFGTAIEKTTRRFQPARR